MEETHTVSDLLAFENRLATLADGDDAVEVRKAGAGDRGVELTSPAQLSVDEDEAMLLVNPTSGPFLPVEVGDEITVRTAD
ncbi:MAG: hypothetical protein ABEJ28_02420 [Salinigranum sp.]